MRKIFPYLMIILLILPASWFLFGEGYFNMHDDLQVMRVFQMDKCFADGQVPCRWSPDMVYGYGQAMFNFYSAFPYYLGALIRLATPLSIFATVKTLFLTSLIAAAIGMYLLAKEFWGKLGGVVAAILYTYAPYHALDIFVRGALSESFALSILPFLWLYLYLLIKKPSFKLISLTSIFFALLLTTHNISSMIYAPFTILWVLFWIIWEKRWKSIKYIASSGLIGLGLSSFFLLPATIEQSLIQVEHLTSEYSDFHAHFVSLSQLFLERSWGFGPSIFGPYDDLSFQIGWPHWWLMVPLLPMGLLRLKKKQKKNGILILSLIGLFLFTAFLAHPRSLFIWEALPLINFVQFPWRFLGLTIFFLSFVGGAIAKTNWKILKLGAILVVFASVGLNLHFFKPYNFSREVNDQDKLTGIGYELQQKSAVLDYLPKTAEQPPGATASPEPDVISGEGEVSSYTKQSNRFSFDADIYQDAEVVIPVMYFPNWIIIVDNIKVPSSIHGAHGVISVKLPPGKHIVRGRFLNTPIRSFGNFITVASVILLFSGLVLTKNKKRLRK